MTYLDGTKVKVGDRVQLWLGNLGVVVCSMDDGNYSTDYPAESWAYLGRGVMIDSAEAGLVYYTEADEDLVRLTD